MTQEEKELFLRDLCARLSYGVKCDYEGSILSIDKLDVTNEEVCGNLIAWYDAWPVEKCKPYLRPMSSMTEEERKELSDYLCEQVMSNKIGITIPPNPTQGKGIPFIWMGDCLDWLNEHHFDYRGLIEKGLALEAPENMYKINDYD